MNATDELEILRNKINCLMSKRYQTKMKLRKHFHSLEPWEVEKHHLKIKKINEEIEELTMIRDDLYADIRREERIKKKMVEDNHIPDLPLGARPLSLVLKLPDER
jgi:glucan phosphorylase